MTLIVRADKRAEIYDAVIGAATPPRSKFAEFDRKLTCCGSRPRPTSSTMRLPWLRPCPRKIIPLLNGVDHVAVLRARFGHDRVVPTTIAHRLTCGAPRKICLAGAPQHCGHRRAGAQRRYRKPGTDLGFPSSSTARRRYSGLSWPSSNHSRS